MFVADNVPVTESDSLVTEIRSLGQKARLAASVLAHTNSQIKNRSLETIAALLRQRQEDILRANQDDLEQAKNKGLPLPLQDRLTLTPERIEVMAAGVEQIVTLPDPVGRVLTSWDRPNGLHIERVSVPIGVIGMIYESRPNVTIDAAGLCIKSGNAVILRGGSESFFSSSTLATIVREGLSLTGLPSDVVQLIPTTDRNAVSLMLKMTDNIDLIIPRGGRSLIEKVSEESRIPLLKHLEGICHVYVDRSADLQKALNVTLNSKMRRTSICGAAETLLVHCSVIQSHLPSLVKILLDNGCTVRGDSPTQTVDARVQPVDPVDWDTEYLDACISVGVVADVDAAISHINTHGSFHTDTIITEDDAVAEHFLSRVESAIVLRNASTQFADGGEFGMGAEIGISTGKLHARGPVGVEQLNTYKYVVRGNGQIRS